MLHSLIGNLGSTLHRWERDPLLKFLPHLQEMLPNCQCYLVGGSVRDAILDCGRNKDFDFVVRGVVPRELERALSALGSVDLVGKTFGVFKFTPMGVRSTVAVDIALPRTEHALGTGGYREVHIQSDPQLPIEKDLERRDFTINAMAVELAHHQPFHQGHLIDPFNGFTDLCDKKIRTVGAARERFQEDYSRMLRALRFACQLNFVIEPATWEALVSMMEHINTARNGGANKQEFERVVPYEVIAKEILRSLWTNPVKAFDLFFESGATRVLIPELLEMKGCPHPPEFHNEGDVWAHTRLALSTLSSLNFKEEFPDDPITMETIIGVLFHDIGKPRAIIPVVQDEKGSYRYHGHDKISAEIATGICNRLKLSSQPKESELHVSTDHIAWIIKKHLLLLNSKIEEMRSSTIERYFFNPRVPGITLLQVILADSLATVPVTGKPILNHFRVMKRRIEELVLPSTEGTAGLRSRGLVAPLLSGNDVIETFQLNPGPKIGKLLRIVREEQLNGMVTTRQAALERIRKELRKEGTTRRLSRHLNLKLSV